MSTATLEEALLRLLKALPAHKQQEVLDFASFLAKQEKRPFTSLRGICAGLGPAITEADIAEARKEMWGNFPREL